VAEILMKHWCLYNKEIYYPTRQIVMSVRANFMDIYFWGECVTDVCEAEWNWIGKSSQLIGQQQETC